MDFSSLLFLFTLQQILKIKSSYVSEFILNKNVQMKLKGIAVGSK